MSLGRQFVIAYLRQCADEELDAAESTSLLEPGGKDAALDHYRAPCALHTESDNGGGMEGTETHDHDN